MRYAAPLKMNKVDSAITKVFGKAKYFGIYDDTADVMNIIKNEQQGGPAIFNQLIANKVDVILTSHAGPGAVNASIKFNIDLYYCGSERKTLKEAVAQFKQGEYIKITPENFELYH